MPKKNSPPSSAVPVTEPASDCGALQKAFFEEMGCAQQFRALFDHLPEVFYFAKNRDGHFVAFDTVMAQRLGFGSESGILGKCDADIHPPRSALEIRADDLRVMSSREPLIDRVEMLYTRSHANGWYATTKLPIVNARGEVIGVMGFVRPYRPDEAAGSGADRLEGLVAHIQKHHGESLSVGELARLGSLSSRQIHRLFHRVFGMSPQTFIVRTRVQAASEDLRLTTKPLSEIALEHGFCDQSAFSRRFSEHTGETPLKFRQRQRRSRSGGKI